MRPSYFGGDEAHFAAIGGTRSPRPAELHGDRFPLFFNLADPLGDPRQPWGDTYYHPIAVLSSIAMTLSGPPPLSRRRHGSPIASSAVSVSAIALHAAARRIDRLPAHCRRYLRRWSSPPVHFILSRQALDYVLPVPFAAGGCGASTARFATRRGISSRWRRHSRRRLLQLHRVLGGDADSAGAVVAGVLAERRGGRRAVIRPAPPSHRPR